MYKLFIKRLLDVIGAFVGICVLAVLMLVVSLIILCEDPGPVFFVQKRVGINGKLFKMVKFRSMKLDAPHDVPTHLLMNPGQYMLKCGSVIRRYSIDEIPQLFNILKGDMSFVGPRPALWNQNDLIEEREKYGANAIKPGLTGLAQISGRDLLDIPKKAKLDGQYAENISFTLDLKCLFLTIGQAIRHEGVCDETCKKEKEMK